MTNDTRGPKADPWEIGKPGEDPVLEVVAEQVYDLMGGVAFDFPGAKQVFQERARQILDAAIPPLRERVERSRRAKGKPAP